MAELQGITVEDIDTLQNNKCPKCHGSGWVQVNVLLGSPGYGKAVPCSCKIKDFATSRRESLLRYCELPPMAAETLSFAKFNVYKEVRYAYEEAKEIANNPHQIAWVTFMGDNDVGKTHLAVAICKAWMEQGVAAKYTYVPLLMAELKEGFSKHAGDDYNIRFKRFCNVPLLLLDDLGKEYSTPWVLEKLETLIDYRLMNKLSLVVTTNNTIDELPSGLGSRLVRHPNTKLVVIQAEEYTLRQTKK